MVWCGGGCGGAIRYVTHLEARLVRHGRGQEGDGLDEGLGRRLEHQLGDTGDHKYDLIVHNLLRKRSGADELAEGLERRFETQQSGEGHGLSWISVAGV